MRLHGACLAGRALARTLARHLPACLYTRRPARPLAQEIREQARMAGPLALNLVGASGRAESWECVSLRLQALHPDSVPPAASRRTIDPQLTTAWALSA